MALSCGLLFHQHPAKQLVTSRELRQQPEISSLTSTPCTCSCRCRSVTCNICTRKSTTACLKHMFVDKPIQPLLLPHQEQNREVHHLVSSRLSSSTRLQLQQEQNVEAQHQSVSSRLGSSALAPNSSDLNMANCEVRGIANAGWPG